MNIYNHSCDGSKHHCIITYAVCQCAHSFSCFFFYVNLKKLVHFKIIKINNYNLPFTVYLVISCAFEISLMFSTTTYFGLLESSKEGRVYVLTCHQLPQPYLSYHNY